MVCGMAEEDEVRLTGHALASHLAAVGDDIETVYVHAPLRRFRFVPRSGAPEQIESGDLVTRSLERDVARREFADHGVALAESAARGPGAPMARHSTPIPTCSFGLTLS
jgi:hypothetical protein